MERELQKRAKLFSSYIKTKDDFAGKSIKTKMKFVYLSLLFCLCSWASAEYVTPELYREVYSEVGSTLCHLLRVLDDKEVFQLLRDEYDITCPKTANVTFTDQDGKAIARALYESFNRLLRSKPKCEFERRNKTVSYWASVYIVQFVVVVVSIVVLVFVITPMRHRMTMNRQLRMFKNHIDEITKLEDDDHHDEDDDRVTPNFFKAKRLKSSRAT